MWQEGAARFCSQLLTYGLEAEKTFFQVHGRLPARMGAGALVSCVCQSAFTSGVVYQIYYSVHRGMCGAGDVRSEAAAGVVAALAASVIKIPISNCMRVMQATPALPTFVHAGRNICRASGPAALYSGYMWSIAEDIIEMDVRLRVYDAIAARTGGGTAGAAVAGGFAMGAVSGGIAAALTTPFDNVRTILAFHASERANGAADLRTWWRINGARCLYRGARLRAVSTGLKTAYFYAFLEGIQSQVQKRK